MFARFPLIPIVLLINAVELQKFVILVGKTLGRSIGERFNDGARQKWMRFPSGPRFALASRWRHPFQS